jgi:hypothetical protein
MFIVKSPYDYVKIMWLDEYMVGHNGFIAGGCFKNIFENKPVKDVDIFFRSDEDFQKAVIHYRDHEDFEQVYENDNVIAFRKKGRKEYIELIRTVFGSPQEIIQEFDFTITKFAYYQTHESYINEDGREDERLVYKCLVHDQFFEHLMLHRTVIDDKITRPVNTFERMIKYTRYGFYPCKETKMKIIQAIWDLEERPNDVSNVLYDGLD